MTAQMSLFAASKDPLDPSNYGAQFLPKRRASTVRRTHSSNSPLFTNRFFENRLIAWIESGATESVDRVWLDRCLASRISNVPDGPAFESALIPPHVAAADYAIRHRHTYCEGFVFGPGMLKPEMAVWTIGQESALCFSHGGKSGLAYCGFSLTHEQLLAAIENQGQSLPVMNWTRQQAANLFRNL